MSRWYTKSPNDRVNLVWKRLTQESVWKVLVPRATWKGTSQPIVVDIKLQESVVAQVSIISRNRSLKSIVVHVQVLQNIHIHISGQCSGQGVVTKVKVEDFWHADAVGQGSTELIIVQIEVACGV